MKDSIENVQNGKEKKQCVRERESGGLIGPMKKMPKRRVITHMDNKHRQQPQEREKGT